MELMLPKEKLQLFECQNPAIYCETFCCFQPAKYFIGRPDGPIVQHLNLCSGCVESLFESMFLMREDEYRAYFDKERDRNNPQAGAYPCKFCGEVFPTPQKLGGHMKRCAKEARLREAETVVSTVEYGS